MGANNIFCRKTLSLCEQPIFIVGPPRSGTSVLQWALLEHDALWGSEESEYLIPLVNGIRQSFANGTKYGQHSWLIKQQVTEADFFQYIGLGVNALISDRAGGKRWIDKTPSYVNIMQGILKMFPLAKFLLIIRDGRQTVTSMKKMFNWSQYKASLTWKEHVQNGIDFLQKNQGKIYLIKYETLVLKTESEFRKIFEFLELNYEPKTTDFLRTRPPINVAPGTASESSIEKLNESRIDWSFIDKIIYNHVCKDTEFTLKSIS